MTSTLTQRGRGAIDWAGSHATGVGRVIERGLGIDRPVIIVSEFEPMVAHAAMTLVAAGHPATIVVPAWCAIDPSLATVVADAGVRVAPTVVGDDALEVDDQLVVEPGALVLDHAGLLTATLRAAGPELIERVAAISEVTERGVGRIEGALDGSPPIADARHHAALNDVRGRAGVGSAAIRAVLAMTNRRAGALRLAVLGASTEADGIAATALAMGAQVAIATDQPDQESIPRFDGVVIRPESDLVAWADVVISTRGAVGRRILRHPTVRSGLVAATTWDDWAERDPLWSPAGDDDAVLVRPDVTRTSVEGRVVYLLADGRAVHTRSMSWEARDLNLAVRLAAAASAVDLEPARLHRLGADVDDLVRPARATPRAGGGSTQEVV